MMSVDLEKVKKALQAGKDRGYRLSGETEEIVRGAEGMVPWIEELRSELAQRDAEIARLQAEVAAPPKEEVEVLEEEERMLGEDALAEGPEATEGPTLEALNVGPPYDAATATGMYDLYEG